jgi:hypothetical protein
MRKFNLAGIVVMGGKGQDTIIDCPGHYDVVSSLETLAHLYR